MAGMLQLPLPGKTTGTHLRTILLTSTAMLCFAANSILCRLALAPPLIDAATFTTLRVASAALLLSLIVFVQQRRLPRPSRANPLSTAALFAYLIFFSFAYLRLDAGSGALILIGAVQLSMFTVAFWEGERFLAAQWAGLALAVAGLFYLLLPGTSAPDPLGALLMALSGVAWGCFSLLARRTGEPVEANAATLLACLLPSLALSFLAIDDVAVSATGVLLAMASGAFATGLGYVVWYLALRELAAAHAATVQLSMPALVALGGAGLLGEALTMRLLGASVMMLGGIGLVLRRRIERAPP
jgi:drug/metabolite transporter (DMT)-like permease